MLNKRADKLELLRIAEAVALEKSIDKELIINSMETGIAKAAKSKFGSENDIKVYPNPVSGAILNIKLQQSDAKNVRYTISNVLGQIVAKGVIVDDAIKIDALKAGIYLLEIITDGEKITQKFVKK